MDKRALRASVRARRSERSEEERRAIAGQLAEQTLLAIPHGLQDITCYVSLDGEPGTSVLIARLLEQGQRVWLPRIVGQRLHWVQIGPATEFIVGPLGISQPRGEGVETLDFADVGLLPALAVDPLGRRLGQGGGYFDRALHDVASFADGGPMLVAIVHDDEVVDEVPTEAHDRPVDAILTPTRTIRTPQ